jgi:hypothetical protein
LVLRHNVEWLELFLVALRSSKISWDLLLTLVELVLMQGFELDHLSFKRGFSFPWDVPLIVPLLGRLFNFSCDPKLLLGICSKRYTRHTMALIKQIFVSLDLCPDLLVLLEKQPKHFVKLLVLLDLDFQHWFQLKDPWLDLLN